MRENGGERRPRHKESTSLSKKSEKDVDERKVNETVKQIENLLKSKSNASDAQNDKAPKVKGKNKGGNGRNGYESDYDHSDGEGGGGDRSRKGRKNKDKDPNKSRKKDKLNGSHSNENGTENGNTDYDSNADGGKKHHTRKETNSLTGKEIEDRLTRERTGSQLKNHDNEDRNGYSLFF